MIYFFQFERSSIRLKRVESICHLNQILEKNGPNIQSTPDNSSRKNRKGSSWRVFELSGVRSN